MKISTSDRRQVKDRRKKPTTINFKDRRQADRREARESSSKPSSSSAATRRGRTERHRCEDRSEVSREARSERSERPEKEKDSGFHSLLAGLAENFKSESKSEPKPVDEAKSPEEIRREKIEETGKVLYQHRDFTNGRDDITSRDDYEKIAKGEQNEDFTNHLKDKHPDWSDEQIAKEVKNLQSHAHKLLNDDEIFDHYDTAKDGGDNDGKISDGDLVAGRLKNDIDENLPPNLSVEEINELHEQNPALGNQAITNKYYHQSQQLNELLGGDKDDFMATWPAFGSLASNSAGAVIRDDGVPIDNTVSDQVAQGNRKVFEDIAPHYDSYIKAAQQDDFNYDEWAKKEGFTDKDKFLRQSFDFLEKARTSDDVDKKQENLLASNVLAGRHEQGRLDPEIDRSTAPRTGSELERQIIENVVDQDPTFFMPNRSGSGKLDELDVSQRLHAKPSQGLYSISDPEVKAALWKSLGHEGDPPDGPLSGQKLVDATGTEDWADLNGRMRTIAGLMVAGQRDQRIGEYVLNYDAPDGFSTLDHVGAVAEEWAGKGVGLVNSGREVLENVPVIGGLFG